MISASFLLFKAKLDLSLPTPKRGEVLGAKLRNGLFLSQERAATFKDVCRPSQFKLLKCHLSLSRESRGNRQSKSIELCVSMERIGPRLDYLMTQYTFYLYSLKFSNFLEFDITSVCRSEEFYLMA